MRSYTFPIVVERDEDGYFAECPSLQGCYAQGSTYEEALDNIRDAMHLHIADRAESGESIEAATQISVTTLEIVA